MNFKIQNIILIGIIFLYRHIVSALIADDIVFVVLSQESHYNFNLAFNIKEHLKQNASTVYLSHKDFKHIGAWTVIPFLPIVYDKHKETHKWLFVCTERTEIDVDRLLVVINKYNVTEKLWFGHGLYDREASIVHHFAFFDNPERFLYPNIASGFVMSFPLLESVVEQILNQDSRLENTDFSIDASHELAVILWQEGTGVEFTHDESFCIHQNEKQCATFVQTFRPCGDLVSLDSIYFAVKTCAKFHYDRIPVIKQTWEDSTEFIEYFSDRLDFNIPTITLGLKNTERGHCAKTVAILEYLSKKIKTMPNIKWIVITDDDTIISPTKLRSLLSCYNNKKSSLLALGERYGYRLLDTSNIGYNYITGGGGMVFSRETVTMLVDGKHPCTCPRPDTPDDMYLGICLAERFIPITHSPQFHQARPNDYASEYLASDETVSFHKHWMINPLHVYQKWFQIADDLWSNESLEPHFIKTEL